MERLCEPQPRALGNGCSVPTVVSADGGSAARRTIRLALRG